MYNEDIKMQFISEYTDSAVTATIARDMFNFFEVYERDLWKADLCTVSADQIQPVAGKILGVKAHSSSKKLSILRAYAKWCVSGDKVPGASDEILKVNGDGLDNIKIHMLASPRHLQSYLDTVFDAESKETMDNVYRCFYWLAYFGVYDSDITQIKVSDVDFENMVIHYRDRELPIYFESLPALKNCVKLSSFRYEHPLYNNPIRRNRVTGDMLVRGFSEDRSINAIRVEIARKAKKKNVRMSGVRGVSYRDAFLSGVFYRVYDKERAGIPVKFTETAIDHLLRMGYDTSDYNKFLARRKRLERDYKTDYERWKAAFGV